MRVPVVDLLLFFVVPSQFSSSYMSASVVRMKRSLDIDGEEPFVADHPCLWALRHNPSGLWLFLGRLSQPDPFQPTQSSVARDEL